MGLVAKLPSKKGGLINDRQILSSRVTFFEVSECPTEYKNTYLCQLGIYSIQRWTEVA
jgi:hypothetical protein